MFITAMAVLVSPLCEEAGFRVHKRTVVVCRLTRDGQGARVAETQTFGTTTDGLLRLSDWLAAGGCTHVGLESTGECWKPVFNLLAGACAVWLLNAAHIKAVPGRKTDVKDAQWIAELLAHGLVRPSFIPPRPQRELRDLTRYRTTFVRERVNLVNRVHKALEGANLALPHGKTLLRGRCCLTEDLTPGRASMRTCLQIGRAGPLAGPASV